MKLSNELSGQKIKKKIILYGAFDRYNYGDNLMPIIFKMYVEKYHSNIFERYEFEFCSISKSNLSGYGCFESTAIKEVLSTTPEGSLIIVIGGEVLCASNLTLLMHMQNSYFTHAIMRAARFLLRRYLKLLTSWKYGTTWEYPYIPPKSAFEHNVKIAFNTIGGGISGLPVEIEKNVVGRLKSADYISVRDKRTHKEVSPKVNTKLYPDSVFLISELINTEFLFNKVNDNVQKATQTAFFCFQASPHKVDTDFEEVVSSLVQISKQRNEKIVLLPIGYASGHDDGRYLKKLAKRLAENCILLDELNVWEIMYVIKEAKLFIGTSLHGVITAMAFNVPHFGLNPKIFKVDSFLYDWGIAPFNKSLPLNKIVSLSSWDFSEFSDDLKKNSSRLSNLVKKNNDEILNLCVA